MAIGAAVALESIALYVGWHAHDALLQNATAPAARLRRASYIIAFGVAGINYSHFANPDWSPTGPAVVFAVFSASQPWLWGLHSRRASHMQLLRDGVADSVGALFSAERWRAFPIRSWMARRWSIDRGIADPRQAWAGYNRDRAVRARARRVAHLRRTASRATANSALTVPTPTRPAAVDSTPAVEVEPTRLNPAPVSDVVEKVPPPPADDLAPDGEHADESPDTTKPTPLWPGVPVEHLPVKVRAEAEAAIRGGDGRKRLQKLGLSEGQAKTLLRKHPKGTQP